MSTEVAEIITLEPPVAAKEQKAPRFTNIHNYFGIKKKSDTNDSIPKVEITRPKLTPKVEEGNSHKESKIASLSDSEFEFNIDDDAVEKASTTSKKIDHLKTSPEDVMDTVDGHGIEDVVDSGSEFERAKTKYEESQKKASKIIKRKKSGVEKPSKKRSSLSDQYFNTGSGSEMEGPEEPDPEPEDGYESPEKKKKKKKVENEENDDKKKKRKKKKEEEKTGRKKLKYDDDKEEGSSELDGWIDDSQPTAKEPHKPLDQLLDPPLPILYIYEIVIIPHELNETTVLFRYPGDYYSKHGELDVDDVLRPALLEKFRKRYPDLSIAAIEFAKIDMIQMNPIPVTTKK